MPGSSPHACMPPRTALLSPSTSQGAPASAHDLACAYLVSLRAWRATRVPLRAERASGRRRGWTRTPLACPTPGHTLTKAPETLPSLPSQGAALHSKTCSIPLPPTRTPRPSLISSALAKQEKGLRGKNSRRGKRYSPGSQEVLSQGPQGGRGARALQPVPQAQQSQGLPDIDTWRV